MQEEETDGDETIDDTKKKRNIEGPQKHAT